MRVRVGRDRRSRAHSCVVCTAGKCACPGHDVVWTDFQSSRAQCTRSHHGLAHDRMGGGAGWRRWTSAVGLECDDTRLCGHRRSDDWSLRGRWLGACLRWDPAAREFVAVQGGLGAARSIDPTSGASSVAIGMAFNTFAMLIFLVIGGHHDLIRGITMSYSALPIGGGMPDPDVFLGIAQMGSVIWHIAFQLAAPITVAIFVQNIATGLLGRAMPQLNLLIVNLPLHVGMLLLIVGLGANDFIHGFKDVIEFWPSQVFDLVIGEVNGG